MGSLLLNDVYEATVLGRGIRVARKRNDGVGGWARDLLRWAQSDTDTVGPGMIRGHYCEGAQRFVDEYTHELLQVCRHTGSGDHARQPGAR